MLLISDSARISNLADIEESVKGTQITVRDNVFIDSFVKIKCVGGVGDIIIGNNSYINSGCVLYSGNGISIGEDVLISANCTLGPVNHEYHSRLKTIRSQRFMPSKGGIVIEDDVWIGANVVILDGTKIQKGCVVGAHSLVSGELDSYGVFVGTPLRKIGERT